MSLKPETLAALDALFAGVGSPDAPGLAVGVILGGETVYRRAFGAANIEHGVAMTPDTRLRLASVTKQMTCFALLLLAEDGKLSLDEPVTRLIPELPVLQGAPTLRQLMAHQGGYHDNLDLFYLASGLAPQPPQAAFESLLRQTAASFAPGEKQLYCNGGYTLLSVVIERASGLGFETFLKQRVFEPLGMVQSESVPDDWQVVRNLATLYVPTMTGTWKRAHSPLENNRGEGAAITTVDDMLLWMRALRAEIPRVGRRESWQQLQQCGTLGSGFPSTYALGLNRHRYRGVEVLHHGGSLIGASSQMLTVPAHGLDIIILSNGAMVNPVQMAWQIVDLLLAEHLHGSAPALAASTGLEHLFGRRYASDSGLLLGFGDAGGLLGVSLFNSPTYPFFKDHGEAVGVLFEDGAVGPLLLRKADLAASGGVAPATLPLQDGGQVETLHLLPAEPPPLQSAGADLPGWYAVPDLDARAHLRFEGDALRLTLHGPRGYREGVLQAYSDTVFGISFTDPSAPFFAALRVLREPGKLPRLSLSTGRSRGIHLNPVTESA